MIPTLSFLLQTLNHVHVILTLSAIFTISWAYQRYKRPGPFMLPLPPGPRGLPLVGYLPFLDPELHSHFADLSRAHGPIMKLWLGNKLAVVVTSPSAAAEILRDHDLIFANRDVPEAGRASTYGGSDIVWTPYGAEWRMLRRVCVVKMLGNKNLDSVYDLRRREVREAVRYLKGRSGSPENVGEQMFLTILNVITSMMWGGTVEGAERESLGAEFRRAVADMTATLAMPNVSDFYPSLARFDLQGIKKRVEEMARRFDLIFEKVIQKRLKMDGGDSPEKGNACGSGENQDFVQFLLNLRDEGIDSNTPFTMTHLKALLMDMVVGGSYTTSNTLEFAMAELMNKPEIMRKVQQELDSVIGKDSIVEESHIQNLPYLVAVMKESLRLHPAVPLLIPHSPSKTCTVGQYTIPKDCRVFVNVWAIHRDPSIWDNPLEFDPERFMNSKYDFSGNDFSYFPFGSGRRICAGIAMAQRMSLFLLATLLHSFDWALPDGEKLDLSEKFGIVLKKKIPLSVVPTPRLSNPFLYQ